MIELGRFLSQLNFKNPLLWTYTPLAADAITEFSDVTGIIYHALEGHAAEKKIPLRQKTLQEMEASFPPHDPQVHGK